MGLVYVDKEQAYLWMFEPYRYAFIQKTCNICGRKVWLEYWDGDDVTIRCKQCMDKWEEKSREEIKQKRKDKELALHKKIWGAVCG